MNELAAPTATTFESVVTWVGVLPTADVVVLHYAVNALERVVACQAPDGRVRWTRRLAEKAPHYFSWPVVIDDAGRICIGYPDRIIALDNDGREVAMTPVPSGADAQLGAFVVVDGDVIVALGAANRPKGEGDANALLVRLDPSGARRWSTILPSGEISHDGVHVMRAATGFQQEKMPAWRARSWEPGYFSPLVVSGSHLLATCRDSSGLSRSYGLESESGRLLWATSPQPDGYIGVDARGDFLIGHQGYGTFESQLRSPTGELKGTWPMHGQMVVDPQGRTCVMEMDNGRKSSGTFVRLQSGGGIEQGPSIGAYYTAYPAMNADGTAFLIRDGALMSIDRALKRTTLYTGPEIPNHGNSLVLTRVLLDGRGHAVVGVDKAVLSFSGPFGDVASSAWPCGDGTPGGNPVAKLQA